MTRMQTVFPHCTQRLILTKNCNVYLSIPNKWDSTYAVVITIYMQNQVDAQKRFGDIKTLSTRKIQKVEEDNKSYCNLSAFLKFSNSDIFLILHFTCLIVVRLLSFRFAVRTVFYSLKTRKMKQPDLEFLIFNFFYYIGISFLILYVLVDFTSQF